MTSGKECDLCGLGCGKHPWHERVGETDRFFCCPGCLNVYLILWESGAIRAGQDIRQTELFQRSLQLGLISNRGAEDEKSVKSAVVPESTEELLLHVSGMWCTSCAWLIEHALTALPGMVRAEASFASDLVKVQYSPQLLPRERIVHRIERLGYKTEEYADEADAAAAERRDLIIRTGLAAFLWANVMSFSLALYAGYFEQISGSVRRGLPFVLMALATPVVFYCAQPVLRLAWRGLLNGAIRMEALLSLGILAAYGYSVAQSFRGEIHLYFDTATVIVTLVLAGKLIERNAKEKATRWISQLHRMVPNKVRLLVKGTERFVSIDALGPGETFVVKAGERVPADGVIVQGESHADESLLTGESTPVGKKSGEQVFAGSINLDGILSVQATKSARESTLSCIIDLVEQALSRRSDLERTVDRVSRVFVPCVVLLAVLTFLYTWMIGTDGSTQALMRGITVLVIACPCALGLATPLAVTAALGLASRRGILVRDSRVLETLPKIDAIILDKTGTVTEGKFSLLEILPCNELQREVLAATVSANSQKSARECSLPSGAPINSGESLSFLASIEQYSEHPLGAAVTQFARQQKAKIYDATAVQIHKGLGITGTVERRRVFAGNRRFLRDLGISIDDQSDKFARQREAEGKSVSFFGWDGDVHAVAVFGDRVRSEAIELSEELRRQKIEIRLVSGDAQATTKWVASSLGIESYEAEVLPQHKIDVVRRLQERGSVVAMVGDGINDAPALAQADLGIAMGSGTDIAMRAASVVLVNGGLGKILDVFDVSHKAMRVVRQNLFWAFLYNSIGITFAVMGILNPIMAAMAMLLSSVSVVGNSMRLTRQQAWLPRSKTV